MKMKFLKKNNRFLKSARIFLIFFAGALFILALFPRQGKFRYEFQKGKPWMHELLVAPFDFPIYKSDTEVLSETDSLLKKFQPYFQYDTLVYPGMVEKLNADFDLTWKNYLARRYARTDTLQPLLGSSIKSDILKEKYLQALEQALKDVYTRGIVSDPVQLETSKKNDAVIKVMKGQVVTDRTAENIFTQPKAYENLMSSLNTLSSGIQLGIPSSQRFISYYDPSLLIEPNLIYDEKTSNQVKESLKSELSLTKGMVQEGEKIITLGEPVNDEKFRILQSLKHEYETNIDVSRNYNLIFLGQIILVGFVFFVLYLFLYHFRREVLSSGKKTFFIILLVGIVALMAAITIRAAALSLYVVPFVILPIIIKTFYDARIAIFAHLISLLLIGFWAPNGFEFIFMNFIAGVITIFTLRNVYKRGILFVTAVLVLLSYSLVYTGLSILQEGRLTSIDWRNYAWFAGNALLVLSSYPLIYIFEKTFGFISDATLLELSDTNQPLLRELSEKAPGTLQHSLQVANLAEEAILTIGGNSLLARTAALYHDIGKMDDPMYFIENLTSNFNPHDKLDFEESAIKIISHVQNGVQLAKKHKLPDVLIDFIRTHHGTTKVLYFYRSYLKKYPDAEIDAENFTYPGPKPFSKETAVLMMADSVEAASRSLKTINKEIIDELVEKIINYQISERQFDNVEITFRDFTRIKEVLKAKLINIYHARIEYPE